MITRSPCPASARAISSPMPLLPPVISTFLLMNNLRSIQYPATLLRLAGSQWWWHQRLNRDGLSHDHEPERIGMQLVCEIVWRERQCWQQGIAHHGIEVR